MGQQNPYDPPTWSTPAGQPGPPGPTPPPPAHGIGFLPKALAVAGGLVAALIIVLAIGSNVGHSTSRALGNLAATPAIATHNIKVTISGRGLNETIFFKVVSTDSEKKAFIDGFEQGFAKSSDLNLQVDDLTDLPTNATYVCQINLPSGNALRSVHVYQVGGDNLSRDIAQAGCDAANATK